MFRDNLDIVRYGEDLGIASEPRLSGDSSRFKQSGGQRKTTDAVADGECVHCVLAGTRHISRRGAVAIPRTWIEVPPTVQTSLFNVPASNVEPPTFSLSDVLGTDRDHIFQRQLHDKIAPDLSSEQGVFVRRHWVVPACKRHNQQRAFSLEPLPYLMHVFALFLAAKELTIADSTAEANLFIDTAKTSHIALRMQAAAAAERRA